MNKGAAYIFINLEQAAGFGHIGWGFPLEGDQFYFGSTDHLWQTEYPIWHALELIRYMNVDPGANNDYWAQTGTFEEMLQLMRAGPHVRYHEYKIIPVASANPLLAKANADSMKNIGWNIILNNCVHQSFQIIGAYGGDLPSPNTAANRFPKKWFAAIASESRVLEQSRGRLIIPSMAHRRRKAS
jgi:hypothetical protein